MLQVAGGPPPWICQYLNISTAAALRDISLSDRPSAPFAFIHSRSPHRPHPHPHQLHKPILLNVLNSRKPKHVHVAGTSSHSSAAASMPVIGGDSERPRAAECRGGDGILASHHANSNALLINAGPGGGGGAFPVPMEHNGIIPELQASAKGGSLLAEVVVVSSDLDPRLAVDTIIPDADVVDVLSVCPASQSHRKAATPDLDSAAQTAAEVLKYLNTNGTTAAAAAAAIPSSTLADNPVTTCPASTVTQKPDLVLQTHSAAADSDNKRQSTLSPIQRRIDSLGIHSSTPTPTATEFKATTTTTTLPSGVPLKHKAITNLKKSGGRKTGAISRYRNIDHPEGCDSPSSTISTEDEDEEEEEPKKWVPWSRQNRAISDQPEEPLDEYVPPPGPPLTLPTLRPEVKEEFATDETGFPHHANFVLLKILGPHAPYVAERAAKGSPPLSESGKTKSEEKTTDKAETETSGQRTESGETAQDTVMSNTNDKSTTTSRPENKGAGGGDGGDEDRGKDRRPSGHEDDYMKDTEETSEVSRKGKRRRSNQHDQCDEEPVAKELKVEEPGLEEAAATGLLGLKDPGTASSASTLPVDPPTASTAYSDFGTPAGIAIMASEALKLNSSDIDRHSSLHRFQDSLDQLPPIKSPNSPETLLNRQQNQASQPLPGVETIVSNLHSRTSVVEEAKNPSTSPTRRTFIRSHVNLEQHTSPERDLTPKGRDAYLQKQAQQAQQASTPPPPSSSFHTPASTIDKESPATLSLTPNGATTPYEPSVHAMQPPTSPLHLGNPYQLVNNNFTPQGSSSTANSPFASTGPSTAETFSGPFTPHSKTPAKPKSPTKTKTQPVFDISSSSGGAFKCEFPGCTANAFQTQYLLNSHAKVHSESRPHYCPVAGCSRGHGKKGFKRKNEMIRHGLVHESPGYICPFCPEKEHRYPRPDNLQRHVKVHHRNINKEDPALRDVLNQRPEGVQKNRRRRNVSTGSA